MYLPRKKHYFLRKNNKFKKNAKKVKKTLDLSKLVWYISSALAKKEQE
jgi:hypothetical protein